MLAIFDLDETRIDGDSSSIWLRLRPSPLRISQLSTPSFTPFFIKPLGSTR